MGDLLHALAAPLLLAAIITLALGAVLIWDIARAHSPRARTLRRLRAMQDSFIEEQNDDAASNQIFFQTASGRLAALLRWLRDLSLHVGGVGKMRILLTVTAILAFVAATMASAFGMPSGEAAIAGGAVGVGAFTTVRGEMRRRWSIRFLDQLIEAVDLISRSISSGYAVPAAIRLVGEEMTAPVGPVFARLADEDELGVDFRTSMTRAARSVGLSDFTFLATALMLQRETGGALSNSLENLQVLLRKRREARLKIKALTSEGRTSANVVAVIPVVAGVAVYFINPDDFHRMLADPSGRTMFGVAIGMLVVGLVVVRVMTRPTA